MKQILQEQVFNLKPFNLIKINFFFKFSRLSNRRIFPASHSEMGGGRSDFGNSVMNATEKFYFSHTCTICAFICNVVVDKALTSSFNNFKSKTVN
jgi:hypothetical protein